MANLDKIISIMEEIAPPYLAESWDNCGLQIGDPFKEITKITISLDPDLDAVENCVSKGSNLLITHHPLFFSNIRSVDFSTTTGRLIKTAVANDLAVYSAHTNLDSASNGLNDYFFKKIGLSSKTPILPYPDNNKHGLGRISYLEKEICCIDFAAQIKKKLEIDNLRISGNSDVLSSIIGVCTGSGTSLMEKAFNLGAKIFVTGDVKYHDAQKASELGIGLIDAGHYGTEKIVCELLKERLDLVFKDKGLSVEVDIFYNKDVFLNF
ncbi:MAG: Nif3-like dinuclear metal center hexameric protein [Desulfobacteraceae bacterium]|nr:Nif3-like dinuclear metal center hexameric protein [Desulfobacteraceae bacterium]MCB9495150.1 Nif3-like dinuclear metal center hexameric protein [Desulfobacteraceae bacterium]